MTQTHTPTPWKYDGDGFDSIAAQECGTDGYTVMNEECLPICDMVNCFEDDVCQANAAFIVKACNAHDELVEFIEEVSIAKLAFPDDETQQLRQRKYFIERATAILSKVKS